MSWPVRLRSEPWLGCYWLRTMTRSARRLSKSLTAAGHVVTALAGGADGIAAVARDKPDVLLLDLGLPDLDGRDVLAMVRSVSDVPVIVATARDDDASVVALLDAGADDSSSNPSAPSRSTPASAPYSDVVAPSNNPRPSSSAPSRSTRAAARSPSTAARST